MYNSAVLLVRSVSAVVCLVAPGVHVDTEAVSAGELRVITRGEGDQHIMGLTGAPVSWSAHMVRSPVCMETCTCYGPGVSP